MEDSAQTFYEEKDKNLATFLLASDGVAFCGTKTEGQTIYFLFKPRKKALKLVKHYFSRTEPHIPAKTLLEAVDSYRTILFKAKDEMRGSSYGEAYGQKTR